MLSVVIAKHHAGKSNRIGPSIVSGNETAAPASSAARSGGHQPDSGSTSSFITTTYGVRAARTPALTGEAKPWGGQPLSMITISWATSVVAWTAAMHARTRSEAASSVGITTVTSGSSPAGRRPPPVRAPGEKTVLAAVVTTRRPRSASETDRAPATSWPGRSRTPTVRRSVARTANAQAATGLSEPAPAPSVALAASPTAGSPRAATSGASHPEAGTAASRRNTMISPRACSAPRRADAANPRRRSLRSTSTSPASWERSGSRPTEASSTTMISWAGSSAWAAMPCRQRRA